MPLCRGWARNVRATDGLHDHLLLRLKKRPGGTSREHCATVEAPCASGRSSNLQESKPMIIDLLRQEHRNIEKLLRVLEQELNVFDRGERPDYEVIGAVIAYFEVHPG